MEGPKFSIEALDYEQKKQEKLLQASNKEGRKMVPGEVRELLGQMDKYTTELSTILMQKRAELKKSNSKAKGALIAEIEEIEAQINDLEEFQQESKDAEEFTAKEVK
jgi:hypothetical protein